MAAIEHAMISFVLRISTPRSCGLIISCLSPAVLFSVSWMTFSQIGWQFLLVVATMSFDCAVAPWKTGTTKIMGKERLYLRRYGWTTTKADGLPESNGLDDGLLVVLLLIFHVYGKSRFHHLCRWFRRWWTTPWNRYIRLWNLPLHRKIHEEITGKCIFWRWRKERENLRTVDYQRDRFMRPSKTSNGTDAQLFVGTLAVKMDMKAAW